MILFETFADCIAASSNPCYVERILMPRALMFQINNRSLLNTGISPVITIEILNPATGAVMADVTSSFSMTTDGSYYTFTMDTYPEYACTCGKFCLKVSIPYYNIEYYLGVYAIESCCPVVYDVYLNGVLTPEKTTSAVSTGYKKFGSLITIASFNSCTDKFTGEYFDGSNVFIKNSTVAGRIYRLPRVIEKKMALNCNVLSSSSAALYRVEIWDLLPEWKMEELSLQLQHERIFINDKEFKYAGGSPAKEIEGVCMNAYKMTFDVQECTIIQKFGCGDACDVEAGTVNTFYYRMPSPTAPVYDENGFMITAGVSGEFADYLRGIDGTISSTAVSGTVNKVQKFGIATSFYSPTVTQANLIYPYPTEEAATPIVPVCAKPVIGTITSTATTCVTPTIGTIITDPTVYTPDVFELHNYSLIIAEDDLVPMTPEDTYIIIEFTNAVVVAINAGSVYYTNFTFDPATATLHFNDMTGINIGDIIYIDYAIKVGI